jgi:hypothetical protein
MADLSLGLDVGASVAASRYNKSSWRREPHFLSLGPGSAARGAPTAKERAGAKARNGYFIRRWRLLLSIPGAHANRDNISFELLIGARSLARHVAPDSRSFSDATLSRPSPTPTGASAVASARRGASRVGANDGNRAP